MQYFYSIHSRLFICFYPSFIISFFCLHFRIVNFLLLVISFMHLLDQFYFPPSALPHPLTVGSETFSQVRVNILM